MTRTDKPKTTLHVAVEIELPFTLREWIEARKAKFSLRALAVQIGASSSYWSKVERGLVSASPELWCAALRAVYGTATLMDNALQMTKFPNTLAIARAAVFPKKGGKK